MLIITNLLQICLYRYNEYMPKKIRLSDFILGVMLGLVFLLVKLSYFSDHNLSILPNLSLSRRGGSNIKSNLSSITITPFPTFTAFRKLFRPRKTPTLSPAITPSVTLTPTATQTITPTFTITPTAFLTPTLTPSITPSVTESPTPTPTVTITPTPTITLTPTPTRVLISYWKMEEGSGLKVADSSGHEYELDLVGNPNLPSWSADTPPSSKVSTFSLYFDGDNFAKLADPLTNLIFDFPIGFTIEAWIKSDSSEQQDIERGIIAKFSNNNGWMMMIPGTKLINAIDSSRLLSASVVRDDKWHHVVITWDGLQQSIYIDGKKEGFLAHSKLPLSTGATFYIGSYNPPDRNFKGKIDEVKIYNYERTQEEIISDAGL